MKRFYYFLIAAICLIPVSEVGAMSRNPVTKPSGEVVTRDVSVQGSFTGINARGIANVEYRQSGGQTKVEVRGHENLLKLLEIQNKSGVLEIGWPRKLTILGKPSVTVIITSPQIEKISTYGTGDITISGPLESDRLELMSYGTGDIEFDRIKTGELRLSVRGSGDIDGESADASVVEISVFGSGDVDISRIAAETATITLSGSGDIEAGGRVKNAVYKLRGSGDIDVDDLRAEDVNATLSGSGDISCYASSFIRAVVAGSGSITVNGNPESVEIKGNKKSVRVR